MKAALDVLRRLADGKVIEPFDAQLAGVVVRRGCRTRTGEETADQPLAGDQALAIALAAAFACRACGDGHSAISVAELGGQALEAQTRMPGALPPNHDYDRADWWTELLRGATCVSDGRAPAPLVLRDGLVQLWRYFKAEERIARRVHEMLRAGGAAPAFEIITGGPGTGKTTYIADKLKQMVVADTARTALAAPTGKAATRLTETLRQRLGEVQLPLKASTIHRLLGTSKRTTTFTHNEENHLAEDFVIVDEASMVDVLLMDALLRAMKPGARLMLVGDQHQLSSVGAGDLLGELCREAKDEGPGSPLFLSVTWLTRSWRFEERPGIGALAKGILAGDGDAVLAACADSAAPYVQLQVPPRNPEAILEPVLPHLRKCLEADSPAALLDALGAFRLLAPEREERLGVSGINAAVERWLEGQGRAVRQDLWYHGRPVLVTENNYALGVFNGDLGVVWRDDDGVAVYFPAEGGATRKVSRARLPRVETAWAMTVHKAQGSEFNEVLVVFPEYESRLLSRELLYTAVTRARQSVTIFAGEGAIRSAVGRSTGRTSGLAGRLREVGG
ncbi:MAG: exodeoxyribonuclease V subunit alpha [Chloroflexi bacterium]|nr:exodeoxyribonuclease V subunit alpha [Chloroflexota bacterium]